MAMTWTTWWRSEEHRSNRQWLAHGDDGNERREDGRRVAKRDGGDTVVLAVVERRQGKQRDSDNGDDAREPTRACDRDREAKTPGYDGGKHDNGDGTRNKLSTLERSEEDGSGGATIASGREEQCRG